MKLYYAAYSTVGAVRLINEDNVYLNGISKAKNQANFVCKGKSSEKRQLFAVLDGLGGEENGEVAALAFKGKYAMTVNLGDSLIYLFREGNLTRLTHDHTEYTALLEYEVLTEDDYYTSPAETI